MVQVGHACLEAGNKFVQPQDSCHLVLVGVTSQTKLLDAFVYVQDSGVQCVLFYEPDDDLAYTAFCTEPITQSNRRIFKRFSTWTDLADNNPRDRGPPNNYK